MIYENKAEYVHRLNRTIILCEGKPVVVHAVNGTDLHPILTLLPLPTKPDKKFDLDAKKEDHKLCVKPFPLGYVNFKTGAAFYYRLPVRNQLAGLWQQSLEGKFHNGKPAPFLNVLVNTQEFYNCIMGDYPTMKQALDLVMAEDESKCVAFCRKFAFQFEEDLGLITLGYRGRKIATSENGVKFKLGPAFKYLKEVVQEAKINAA